MSRREEVHVQDFQSLLRKCLDCKELQLVELSATKLLPPGENYCSIMVKLVATVRRGETAENETLHLVAKTLSPSDRPIVDWFKVFDKEVFVYAELVPAYRILEREAGVEPVLDVLPRYVGHRRSLADQDDGQGLIDENSMLLMENLTARNFYTCDRRVGLNLEHAKLALTSLARYHSLGIALKQKRPNFFKKAIALAQTFGIDVGYVDEGFDAVLKTFRENEESFGKHLPIIERCFENVKAGNSWTRAGTEPWLTVTHGDFWTNNMLFHRDANGRIDDVKFVDFQTYLYNSPLKDLPYFLCGSLDEDAKANRMDELLDLYHVTFVRSLVRLGCDPGPYGREAFDAELKRQAINEFPLCALAMKFFVFEADAGVAKLEADSVFRSDASDAFAKVLRQLVQVFEKRGWFL